MCDLERAANSKWSRRRSRSSAPAVVTPSSFQLRSVDGFHVGHAGVYVKSSGRQTKVTYRRGYCTCPDRGWYGPDHPRCAVSARVRGRPRSRRAASSVLDVADPHLGDSQLAGGSDRGVLRSWTTRLHGGSRPSCVWLSASHVPRGPHVEVEAGALAPGRRFQFTYVASSAMLNIPERLEAACRSAPARRAWLEMLPLAIGELQDRWSLSLGSPFDGSDGIRC